MPASSLTPTNQHRRTERKRREAARDAPISILGKGRAYLGEAPSSQSGAVRPVKPEPPGSKRQSGRCAQVGFRDAHDVPAMRAQTGRLQAFLIRLAQGTGGSPRRLRYGHACRSWNRSLPRVRAGSLSHVRARREPLDAMRRKLPSRRRTSGRRARKCALRGVSQAVAAPRTICARRTWLMLW
jgi:hypothetical protein